MVISKIPRRRGNSIRHFARLPAAENLTITPVALDTTDRRARVVVLAGPPGSGKTTLLCCLYACYFKGQFAGVRFAGSRSLRALEEISHENRAESGLEVPTTLHTTLSQTGFISLRLQPATADASTIEFLFSDLSGETYRETMHRPGHVATMTALQRADSIVIAVDGDALVGEERHQAAHEANILTRAIVEHSSPRNDADIDIVLTKWDAMAKAAPVARAYAQGRLDELNGFVRRTHSSELLFTCGRSLKDPTMSTGAGLDQLVARWCRKRKPYTPIKRQVERSDANAPASPVAAEVAP